VIQNPTQLQNLQDPLKKIIQSLADRFHKATGEDLYLVEGYRSQEKQKALYEQGRTASGPIVTDAGPLFSFHNYGLAIDVVPVPLKETSNWSPSHSYWNILGKIGESLGLEWGGKWANQDKPHFEYHPGLTIQEVRNYFLKTGEVLFSKVLRPEFLLLLLGGVWLFMQYFRKKVT